MRQPVVPPGRYPFYDKLLFATYVLVLPPLLASKPGLFDDGDVSWHVAAGRWILAHRQVPDADPFSFTMAGQPWVAHEWLAEIVLAGAFDLAGYAGLAAIVAAAMMLLHLVIFLHLRARAGPIAMLAAFMAMDLILAKFLLARPHVLVWPLVAAWTSVLLASRQRERPPPLPMALLMLVWSNLHGSFALGLIIAGAIGWDAVAAAGWSRRTVLGWLNFGLLALLATLCNINGAAGLLHPLAIMGMDTLHLIDEWNPSSLAGSPLFYLVLGGTAALLFVKRPRLGFGEAALLVVMLALALSQIRHQSWLAIVAVLVLAPRLAGSGRERAPPAFARSSERRALLSAGAAAAILLIAARGLLPLEPREGTGTPRRLLANIPAELRSQPVFNEYTFGGPLILAGIRPYIDGRADMYGDAFFREYSRIANGGDFARFERAVDRYGIRWTMLPKRQPLVRALDASPEWGRILADEVGVVHVRRVGNSVAPVAGARPAQ